MLTIFGPHPAIDQNVKCPYSSNTSARTTPFFVFKVDDRNNEKCPARYTGKAAGF